ARENLAAALTFEFEIQSVGFPYFTIEASEGTIVELLVHEAHQVNGTHALLNTHFHSWTKFTCKEGKNHFEVFDYESLRWLQLHIRNARGTVRISEVGMRRRAYPFPQTPRFQCSDKKLEKLFSACVNTVTAWRGNASSTAAIWATWFTPFSGDSAKCRCWPVFATPTARA
ncbi:MAG: hypothetical protein MUD08_13470, partial [Cytophagales bacterium]|nr:hypothetical protein [Cytophagales bacterium]